MSLSNCEVLGKIENFSDENIHRTGKNAMYNCDFLKGNIYLDHIPKLYANGSNEANNGFISIVIGKSKIPYNFKITYIVSVLDFEGNSRFTRSLTVEEIYSKNGCTAESGFDKYIARETLLCQSSELLPQDKLTLHIGIYRNTLYDFFYPDDELEDHLISCFEYFKESNEYALILDSDLEKRLSEESVYFKRMSETPMLERTTGQWKVCDEESHAFFNIARIMLGAQYIKVTNIMDVHSMYITADKYDIRLVKDICRHLFRKYVCDGNAYLILYVAHTFNDDILKEIVERFEDDSAYRNKQNERNSEWGVESQLENPVEPQSISDFEEKPKLDFYC